MIVVHCETSSGVLNPIEEIGKGKEREKEMKRKKRD